MASISSMKMMHGAVFLAAANSSRTLYKAEVEQSREQEGRKRGERHEIKISGAATTWTIGELALVLRSREITTCMLP